MSFPGEWVRSLVHAPAGSIDFLLALALWFALHAIGIVHAAEVAGVRIDAKASVGEAELLLNGAGIRQRFRTDVYIIAVYLVERTDSAESAIASHGAKRIALTFLRDVTAQSLVDAMYEGLRDNATESEFAGLKRSADRLSAVMLPLGIARKGEIVALDYLPGAGSKVVFNGRAVGHPVPGAELYRALLRIWLGRAPVDVKLKHALLGRN